MCYVQEEENESEQSQKPKPKVEILRADSELDSQPGKSRLSAIMLGSPETIKQPKLDCCANFVNSAKSQMKSPTGRGVFMSPKAQPHLLSSSRSPVSPMSPTQKEVEILGYKGAYAKLLNAANKVINSNRNAAAERSRSVVHSKQLQKRPSANAAPSRPSQRNKSLPHQPSVEPNQITTQTCNQPTALQQ